MAERQLPPRHWVAGAPAIAWEQLFPTMHFRLTYGATVARGSAWSTCGSCTAATTMEATQRGRCCFRVSPSTTLRDLAEPKTSSGAGLVWEAGPENLRPPAHGQPGGGGGVRMDTSVMQERIGQLCGQFKLPPWATQRSPPPLDAAMLAPGAGTGLTGAWLLGSRPGKPSSTTE